MNSNFEELKGLVISWAQERDLYEKGDSKTQALKLVEEVGELAAAILKDKPKETKDALGDIQVVLINLSVLLSLEQQTSYDLEECLAIAYDEIKRRKGKMVNGNFVKDGGDGLRTITLGSYENLPYIQAQLSSTQRSATLEMDPVDTHVNDHELVIEIVAAKGKEDSVLPGFYWYSDLAEFAVESYTVSGQYYIDMERLIASPRLIHKITSSI